MLGEGGGVECISVGRLEEGEGQQGESVCSRWRITMFATTATQCEDEFLVFYVSGSKPARASGRAREGGGSAAGEAFLCGGGRAGVG